MKDILEIIGVLQVDDLESNIHTIDPREVSYIEIDVGARKMTLTHPAGEIDVLLKNRALQMLIGSTGRMEFSKEECFNYHKNKRRKK